MHPNECVKWYLAVLAVLVVPIRPQRDVPVGA
jgi:hypothetical protein